MTTVTIMRPVTLTISNHSCNNTYNICNNVTISVTCTAALLIITGVCVCVCVCSALTTARTCSIWMRKRSWPITAGLWRRWRRWRMWLTATATLKKRACCQVMRLNMNNQHLSIVTQCYGQWLMWWWMCLQLNWPPHISAAVEVCWGRRALEMKMENTSTNHGRSWSRSSLSNPNRRRSESVSSNNKTLL